MRYFTQLFSHKPLQLKCYLIFGTKVAFCSHCSRASSLCCHQVSIKVRASVSFLCVKLLHVVYFIYSVTCFSDAVVD